jgi:hypothetical protein
VTVQDGAAAVAIGMAAQQSARTGQAVSLPQSPVTAAQVVGL